MLIHPAFSGFPVFLNNYYFTSNTMLLSYVVSLPSTLYRYWAILVLAFASHCLFAQAGPDTLHVTFTRLHTIDTMHLLPSTPPGTAVEIIRMEDVDTVYGRILIPDTVLVELVKLNIVDTLVAGNLHHGHRIIFYDAEDGSPLVGRILENREIQMAWSRIDGVDTLQATLLLPAGTRLELVRLNSLDTLVATTLFADTLLIELTSLARLDTIAAVAVYTLPPQADVPENGIEPRPGNARIWLAGGLHAAAYAGGLIVLSEAWYRNYPRAPLHSFNDAGEWLQVDKVGHAWTSYQLGRSSMQAWKWAGIPRKQQILLGGLGGFGFLTAIEYLDGRSAEWGWSWADVAANMLGSGMFMGQEFAWGEQRILFKFGFHRKNYSEPYLNVRSDNLFGKSLAERGLKDYNGQAYWLSANVRSFFPDSGWPKWLNLAVGYGAEGMFGGYKNEWTDPLSGPLNAFHHKRVRQWYLAPDIDFMKIGTKSKWIRSMFFVLNAIKVPAPTLMFSNGRWKMHAIYL